MKRLIVTATVLVFASVLCAQNNDDFYRNQISFSYGIGNLPNGIGDRTGSFTASYMYRVVKWLGIGATINWQNPSMYSYNWREYDTNGFFTDFEVSKRNNFFAFAPEVRFSFLNKKRATLYTGFSAGYGIYTGIKSQNDFFDFNNYYFWNITFIGVNFHFGQKQHFFAGGEFGLGFKGIYTIHAGYRF